jgi:hypothetical protein
MGRRSRSARLPITGDPPIAHDPKGVLARLVEQLVETTHAREHKLFAGKLDASKLSLAEKLPVKMARGREGDWRDFEAVDEWAAEIADALQDGGSDGSSGRMRTSASG